MSLEYSPPETRRWWQRLHWPPITLGHLAWARRLILPAILTAFLIQGFRLLPGYRAQMNPDGVSYLTIARQYLDGHFADAVNAYWSPLYSWLLMPLLAVDVEPLLATKVLAVFVGVGGIASVWWLLRNLGAPLESRIITSITLFPILYYFGMDVTTPDLLITVALLLYLAQMTRPHYGRRRWDGVVSGLLGGLAYLAKAYALPVVGAHWVLVNLVTIWRARTRRQRKRAMLHAGAGLLAFGVVVGGWSAVLTHKYGYFTTGSTGTFNIAYNGPKWVMSMHAGVLLAPPNATGTSGWDDATVLDYVHWNPLATWKDRQHWEKNRDRNTRETLVHLQKFTWLLWPIVLVGVRLAGSRLDRRPRRPGAILVTLLVLYPLGYWLLHTFERFLSLMCVGLLVLGVFAVVRLTYPLRGWLRVPLRVIGVTAVAWSFVSKPDWNPETDPWPMAAGRWSIAKRWGNDAQFPAQAGKLAGVVPPRARVASNVGWSGTLNLCYLLNLRYYGDLAPRATEAMTLAELTKHDIEFFWVWQGRTYGFLKGVPEISGNKVPGLKIYDLRKPPTTRPS